MSYNPGRSIRTCGHARLKSVRLLSGQAVVDMSRKGRTLESQLEALPKASTKLKLRRINWTTATTALMQAPRAFSINTSYFALRAIPKTSLPAPPPFHYSDVETPLQARARDGFIPFGVMTTIKGISKSAVERNRVRTKFKAAMRLVLTRGAWVLPDPRDVKNEPEDDEIGTQKSLTISDGVDPSKFIMKDYAYLAIPFPNIHSASILDLIPAIRFGLAHIHKAATAQTLQAKLRKAGADALPGRGLQEEGKSGKAKRKRKPKGKRDGANEARAAGQA